MMRHDDPALWTDQGTDQVMHALFRQFDEHDLDGDSGFDVTAGLHDLTERARREGAWPTPARERARTRPRRPAIRRAPRRAAVPRRRRAGRKPPTRQARLSGSVIRVSVLGMAALLALLTLSTAGHPHPAPRPPQAAPAEMPTQAAPGVAEMPTRDSVPDSAQATAFPPAAPQVAGGLQMMTLTRSVTMHFKPGLAQLVSRSDDLSSTVLASMRTAPQVVVDGYTNGSGDPDLAGRRAHVVASYVGDLAGISRDQIQIEVDGHLPSPVTTPRGNGVIIAWQACTVDSLFC